MTTAPTTAIGHTSPKEVELEVGRYNRSARCYCHMILINGKRCLKRILWYFHVRYGLAGGPTAVNRMAVTDLNRIMTPSFVSLEMFAV